MLNARRLVAALAFGVLLSACAHTAPIPVSPGARYVNMGSSFASGAGTGPAAAGSPARCFQSSLNYAHLLAERLDLSLVDVSCGGATSAHMIGPWNELPAQIDAVTSDTRLVTITVGGNDIALAGNLTAASCEQGEIIRVAAMALPCPPPFPVAESAYATLEDNLRNLAHQISVRAPQARTVFIQYVTLVPRTQCAQTRLNEVEATDLRATAARLAEITVRVARETGAEVLPMNELSVGHTPCDAEPWSVGLPSDYREAMGAPWHPNARGMEEIAAELERALR